MRIKCLALLFVLCLCSLPASSQILVYNWSLNGEEYTSTDGKTTYLRQSKLQKGYMVVEYLPDLTQFTNASIIKYWQKSGKKQYSVGKFLNGYAAFEEAQLASKVYLTVSSFSPGTLGEFYSGPMVNVKGTSIGSDLDISLMLNGTGHSAWENSYVGSRSVIGGGAGYLTAQQGQERHRQPVRTDSRPGHK